MQTTFLTLVVCLTLMSTSATSGGSTSVSRYLRDDRIRQEVVQLHHYIFRWLVSYIMVYFVVSCTSAAITLNNILFYFTMLLFC